MGIVADTGFDAPQKIKLKNEDGPEASAPAAQSQR